MRVEMELRHVRRSLVLDFLMEAGGQSSGELAVSGQGWSAKLEEMEPAQIGPSIRVSRDMLIIEGEDDVLPRIHAFMRRKMIRGGG